ncbi:hypothetical protein ONZ51_g2360 [Trametes cubensis]|uniref:Uncharacterized protein n=1 Tax=Trametes cubensis TaxID=1111947 RepID=A0AAD7U2C1_9APHY|nr:hypothetical protein ONZ51_g2360 [Trametes cubensis]
MKFGPDTYQDLTILLYRGARMSEKKSHGYRMMITLDHTPTSKDLSSALGNVSRNAMTLNPVRNFNPLDMFRSFARLELLSLSTPALSYPGTLLKDPPTPAAQSLDVTSPRAHEPCAIQATAADA